MTTAAARRAASDAQAIYLGNLKTVEADLNLPAAGPAGSQITWRSENERVLGSDGTVTRPRFGHGKRDIILHATIANDDERVHRDFRVTVLEEPNRIQIAHCYPIECDAAVGQVLNLPLAVVVETADGKTLSQDVVWSAMAEQPGITNVEWKHGPAGSVPRTCGTVIVRGQVKGTHVPVTATVHILPEVPDNHVDSRPRWQAFDHGEVRLTAPSRWHDAEARWLVFLLGVDDDQMLVNFRRAAGLDTRGAPDMIGWDTPDSLLRGHTTGHYLSALALCWRNTGEQRIASKAAYLVAELADCQRAQESQPGIDRGFLSAYDQTQFDQLEAGVPYPEIWAPYYTLHKLLAGLLDCAEYLPQGASDQASSLANGIGDWVAARLRRLSRDQLATMWGTYIAGEYGGMGEAMARLYGRTGKAAHLATARLFDNDKLFGPLAQGIDALDELHANQHVPQALGALALFEATGERRYFDIAREFWQLAAGSHAYVIGGIGEGEMFHEPGRIAGLLTAATAESCASYNMVKLARGLYRHTGEVALADYAERVSRNHLLPAQDRSANGATTYFMPLAPGSRKEFDEENSCCHGTGLETPFMHATGVFFHRDDTLYIDGYLPARLNWAERGLVVQVFADDDDPREIGVQVTGSAALNLRMRVPGWAAGPVAVSVNGARYEADIVDGYLVIDREWADFDVLRVSFERHLAVEPAPDDPDVYGLVWGPDVLAAVDDHTEMLAVRGDPCAAIRAGGEGWVLRTTVGEVPLRPFGELGDEPYHVYLRRVDGAAS